MNESERGVHPAAVLKLLSHTVRWQMLEALSRSDHTVQELVSIVGRPENLVSYHLGRLRALRIVGERRGDADARDVYYSLNVGHLRDLYLAAGRALHPALVEAPEVEPRAAKPDAPTVSVLFLCTHNSARSQMAEAILRDVGKGRVEVSSAGTHPTGVRPEAVQVMAEWGLDISRQRSRHLDEFLGQRFDYVITVCDRAKESCPVFPGDSIRIHWSFPDPASVDGPEATRVRAFRDTAMQLLTRIRLLLIVIDRDLADERESSASPAVR